MNSPSKMMLDFETNTELTEEQKRNIEAIDKFNKNIVSAYADDLKKELERLR
jgi:hypothetical protein